MDCEVEHHEALLESLSTPHKKTLILSLDDCLLKTSIFKQDLPRIDGEFVYNSLNIYVCFRPMLISFLTILKPHFELILWSSS